MSDSTSTEPRKANPLSKGGFRHWEMVRGAIIHEDNLINHRLTWLLITEGFLLSGFFAVQTAAFSAKLSWREVVLFESLLAVILLVSLFICRIIGYAVACAHAHVSHLKEWWMETYKTEWRIEIVVPPDVDKKAWWKRILWWNPIWWLSKHDSDETNSAKNSKTEEQEKSGKPPNKATWPARLTKQPPIIGNFKPYLWITGDLIPVCFFVLNLILCVCIVLALFVTPIRQNKGDAPNKRVLDAPGAAPKSP
ncbi:MAG: hypothetical protein ACHRXM_36140 [Isosphaerales bacterium]